MVKTFELVHGKFRSIVRNPRRIKLDDYGEEIIKNLPNSSFRMVLFEEYKNIDFPIWRRLEMEGLSLPSRPPIVKLETNAKSIYECSKLDILKEYDFEGSDRKYVLLADIFHTSGVCFEGSGKISVKMTGDSIDTNVYVIDGEAKIKRIFDGNFRVTNSRFIIKKNAKLYLEDLLFVSGVEVENIFFYIEENASVEYNDLGVSKGKVAKAVFVIGEKDSKIVINPRVASSSAADVLYFSRSNVGNTMYVDGHGVSIGDGKIIFRGIMDIKKGAVGGDYSEKFHTLLLDESSTFEAIPSLYVQESELSAQHGASSSPIPDDELFYLMSRGFDLEEAKTMIAQGFLLDIDFSKEAEDFVKRVLK